MKHLDLRNHWEYHIQQWLESNKNQTIYCKENNLSVKSFAYWRKKFNYENKTQFIEIKASRNYQQTPSNIELSTPDGMILKFNDDISHQTLKDIISILRG